MKIFRHIVIVGATSAIAQHCARRWMRHSPATLTLVGRDPERTGQVADDLRVRSPQTEVRVVRGEFLDPAGIDATVAQTLQGADVDLVLIAQGALPDQKACEQDLAAAHDALALNATSPALYAEAYARHFERRGGGTLALIGSVAGDRGRRKNYVYGAAKGLVARYAQGLQHRFAGTAVDVVLVKPGPTETPMTAHLKAAGAVLAPVDRVADDIVAGIAKGRAVIYTPSKWWLIMMVIRHLPKFVFGRLDI